MVKYLTRLLNAGIGLWNLSLRDHPNISAFYVYVLFNEVARYFSLNIVKWYGGGEKRRAQGV